VCQEDEGTHHADSHRNQLNHRTHRSHASPRSIKGALPFQEVMRNNVFGRPGRRRKSADPCDRLPAGFGPALNVTKRSKARPIARDNCEKMTYQLSRTTVASQTNAIQPRIDPHADAGLTPLSKLRASIADGERLATHRRRLGR
jgi:hypothetical protein